MTTNKTVKITRKDKDGCVLVYYIEEQYMCCVDFEKPFVDMQLLRMAHFVVDVAKNDLVKCRWAIDVILDKTFL